MFFHTHHTKLRVTSFLLGGLLFLAAQGGGLWAQNQNYYNNNNNYYGAPGNNRGPATNNQFNQQPRYGQPPSYNQQQAPQFGQTPPQQNFGAAPPQAPPPARPLQASPTPAPQATEARAQAPETSKEQGQRSFSIALLEVYGGYTGLLLNSYQVDTGNGNFEGNTMQSDLQSYLNISAGLSFSGHIKRIHYGLWAAMPFNLGTDKIFEQKFEFGVSGASRPVDTPSATGLFDSKQNLMLAGGLRFGFNLYDNPKAKLVVGLGADGFAAEWEADSGLTHEYLVAGVITDVTTNINQKYMHFFAGQISPLVYVQLASFLAPFLEMNLSVAYSPASIWMTEDTRFLSQQMERKYGYLGQTLRSEVDIRFWLNDFFAIRLGLMGQFSFKTVGNTRIFDTDANGVVTDPASFDLILNDGGFSLKYFSAFLGVGLSFARNQ